MTIECLNDLSREVDGNLPTPDQEMRIEAVTTEGDLITAVLECGIPNCDRECAVQYFGDGKLEIVRGVAAGVCARQQAAARWQLEQPLTPGPRSPLEAALQTHNPYDF